MGAAVPAQGRSFWEKAGFKTVVDLKPVDLPESTVSDDNPRHRARVEAAAEAAANAGEDALLDPTTAFGSFLKGEMLLFTDTPLMAKALSGAMPGDDTESEVMAGDGDTEAEVRPGRGRRGRCLGRSNLVKPS